MSDQPPPESEEAQAAFRALGRISDDIRNIRNMLGIYLGLLLIAVAFIAYQVWKLRTDGFFMDL